MSKELLRRMERVLRRFGGPLPIDNLLPELEHATPAAQPFAGGPRNERLT